MAVKKVILPLADGFEEIETVTIIDILRRAGVNVTVAGLKAGEAVGSRCVRLVPDTTLDQVKNDEFDAIVLPGGQPGVDHLRQDPRVLDLLKKMDAKKKTIAAICAAPLVLRDAGLTAGRKLTSYPGMTDELAGCHYQETRVVIDGNLITSRGPGTALEFSLKLVEVFAGKERADEISRMVLSHPESANIR